MIVKNKIQEIQRYIAAGNLPLAINELIEILEGSPLLNEVILHSARLSYLKKDILKGLIEYATEVTERTRITNAVIELLTDIEKSIEESPKIKLEFERGRYLTNIPKNSVDVIGREEYILKINKALEYSDILILNGIAGIGKTSIALKYATSDYAKQYQNIAYIEASDSIAKSIITNSSLMYNLGLSEYKYESLFSFSSNTTIEQKTSEFLSLIVNRLNQETDNLLLIIDNVTDFDDFIANIDLLLMLKAKIVVTSRVLLNIENITNLGVEELSIANLVKIFYSNYKLIQENDESNKVVEQVIAHLQQHTLLVELISKAANRSGILLDELHNLTLNEGYKSQKLQVNIETGGHSNRNKMPKLSSINEYINIIFSNVSDLSEIEKQHLMYFSLMPDQNLTINGYFSFLAVLTTEIEKANKYANTLNSLVAKGWVIKNGNFYYMHPLIRDFVMEKFNPGRKNCPDLFNSPIYLQFVGNVFMSNGDFNLAISVFEKAHSKASALGLSKLDLQMFYLLTTRAYASAGRLVKALRGYQRLERTLDLSDARILPIYCDVLIDLGGIYQCFEQSERGMKLFELAITIVYNMPDGPDKQRRIEEYAARYEIMKMNQDMERFTKHLRKTQGDNGVTSFFIKELWS